MALRNAQKEMEVSLFIKAFCAIEKEQDRKELYIQFGDAYDESIKDWRSQVEQELEDVALKKEFLCLTNKEEKEDIKEFVNSGHSYVAKRENTILGFILAFKCPTFGGHYFLYIDTFVVDREAQGNGIGRMLLEKARGNAFHNRIIGMRLMTKSNIPAYGVYKHMGFEPMDEYVHMSRY